MLSIMLNGLLWRINQLKKMSKFLSVSADRSPITSNHVFCDPVPINRQSVSKTPDGKVVVGCENVLVERSEHNAQFKVSDFCISNLRLIGSDQLGNDVVMSNLSNLSVVDKL